MLRTCLLATTCILLGCSDGRLPTHVVNGVIRFEDGFPVQTGRIECRSREHGILAQGTIHSGNFTLTTYKPDDGAVAGVHDCVVVQFVIRERGVSHNAGTLGIVPQKYASYRTSGLSITVGQEPQNQAILMLESVAADQAKQAEKHQPVAESQSPKRSAIDEE